MGSPSVPQAPPLGNTQNIFNSGLNSQIGNANTAQTYTNNILYNPYATLYQGSANSAAGYLGNVLAPNLQSASGSLFGAANAALPYGSEILKTGFDPDNALYARTQQQVQQQTLAGLAATGTASTPYGAGVIGQTDSNFNIDWQNAQEQRQAQALSSYDSLLSGVGTAYGQAGELGTAAGNATLAAGQLPYSTSNAINTADVNALGTQEGLYSGPTNTAGNWVQSTYGDQMQQYNAEEAQNQALWNSIGTIGGVALGGIGGFGGFGSSLSGLFGGGGDVWAGPGQ